MAYAIYISFSQSYKFYLAQNTRERKEKRIHDKDSLG